MLRPKWVQSGAKVGVGDARRGRGDTADLGRVVFVGRVVSPYSRDHGDPYARS